MHTQTDFSHMEPGDVLTQPQVETIVGIERSVGHDAYAFRLMALRSEIERQLHASGKRYTVCTRDYGVAVLTDPEASEYNDDGFERGIRMAKRRHLMMQCVDAGKLDQDERSNHDRKLVKQGTLLSALASARQSLKVTPVQRNTPRLG